MSGFDDFFQMLSRIARLEPAERPSDRDLADLGLTRADLALLKSGTPGARERIVAMAAQFGVSEDMLDAHPELGLDLAEHCVHCAQAKTCREAILKGRHLPAVACPNAGLYRALAKG